MIEFPQPEYLLQSGEGSQTVNRVTVSDVPPSPDPVGPGLPCEDQQLSQPSADSD